MLPVALTIAGSDPSGGAGIQADLKTFHRFGVYGAAALTLVTVQNTRRVSRVETLDPDLVRQQIDAVLEDIPPQAAKTGALGSAAIIAAVARAYPFPLVVDPVMISKHGAPLIDPEARAALKELLLPRAFLATPNLLEAEALAGFAVADLAGMRRAAAAIRTLGARNVLVKGGHLEGVATDLLLEENGRATEFPAPRIDTPHTHGTGCTYSAAITAGLAQGLKLEPAVRQAKRFIAEAIRTNPGLGGGSGPVNHFASFSND